MFKAFCIIVGGCCCTKSNKTSSDFDLEEYCVNVKEGNKTEITCEANFHMRLSAIEALRAGTDPFRSDWYTTML
eukprot:snap_masked-scaffold_6-processed-gene-13.31-mRNA-1 protein AED:1.00 eAED:1.00 QI:0/0/0/0/1/1/2/0/73